MEVSEASLDRRLRIVLSEGEELVGALRAAALERGVSSAWVGGRGRLGWAELRRGDRAAERAAGPIELLALSGWVRVEGGEARTDLGAVVLLPDGAVVGGRLAAAACSRCELHLACVRDAGEPAGLAEAAAEPRGPEEPAAPGGQAEGAPWGAAVTAPAEAVSWGDVAAASRAREAAPPEEPPGRGDWIRHPKFGMCEIERVIGEGAVLLRLPRSRVRKRVKLSVLRVQPPSWEGERRVFRVEPRRGPRSP